MKIRIGFVANSSSSSFIVIDVKDGYEGIETLSSLLVAGSEIGTTEFGWGPKEITDIGSRINFAYLQALYSQNDDWVEMLETVIKDNSVIRMFEWDDLSIGYDGPANGHIDHQSNYPENTEMFESYGQLKDFIFGKGSKVVLDHDNH